MIQSGLQPRQRRCQLCWHCWHYQDVSPMTPLSLRGTSSLRPAWQVHSPTAPCLAGCCLPSVCPDIAFLLHPACCRCYLWHVSTMSLSPRFHFTRLLPKLPRCCFTEVSTTQGVLCACPYCCIFMTLTLAPASPALTVTNGYIRS